MALSHFERYIIVLHERLARHHRARREQTIHFSVKNCINNFARNRDEFRILNDIGEGERKHGDVNGAALYRFFHYSLTDLTR